MQSKKWTESDNEYLVLNYQIKKDKELAEYLQRSIPAIINQRIKLNLVKRVDKDSVNVICQNCNKSFTVPFSRKNAKFCSRKCKGEYSKNNSGSIRKCIVCGKTFYAAGNPEGRHICSRNCFFAYRKTGTIIKCATCGKDIYVKKYALNRSKHFFCNTTCANEYQTKEKVEVKCKVCGKIFEVHPSTIKHSILRNQKVQYCSILCRDKDPDKTKQLINQNNIQNRNKKKNKLETKGGEILKSLGLLYEEQYLVNNKISVDVFISQYNLIIEWWGDYWHGHKSKIKNGIPDNRQKKRMALDNSQKKYLQKCGYNVLCFWEHDVMKNENMVIESITRKIEEIRLTTAST